METKPVFDAAESLKAKSVPNSISPVDMGEIVEAVAEVLRQAEEQKAPNKHNSSSDKYGVGTMTKYGHVLLKDDLVGARLLTTAKGTAATPAALLGVKEQLESRIEESEESMAQQIESVLNAASGGEINLAAYPMKTDFVVERLAGVIESESLVIDSTSGYYKTSENRFYLESAGRGRLYSQVTNNAGDIRYTEPQTPSVTAFYILDGASYVYDRKSWKLVAIGSKAKGYEIDTDSNVAILTDDADNVYHAALYSDEDILTKAENIDASVEEGVMRTQADFNTQITKNVTALFFDEVIEGDVTIGSAITPQGWSKSVCFGTYTETVDGETVRTQAFLNRYSKTDPILGYSEKFTVKEEPVQTKLYICGNVPYVWNGTQLVQIGGDLAPYALTANVTIQPLSGIGEYSYTDTGGDDTHTGEIYYSTTGKKLVEKCDRKNGNFSTVVYLSLGEPLATKLYTFEGKAYFWNGADLVAMASDTELQKMRARSGDYTLDFNLYAEQVSEVVMFKRTIGRLQLMNVETIRYQINSETPIKVLLAENTENVETPSEVEGEEPTITTEHRDQIAYITTDTEDNAPVTGHYRETLVTLNNTLNSHELPFRLTWTITRTTAGQPAAIGVLYKETDTMA